MSTPVLKRGDRVSVVAPGFAVRHDMLDAGLEALRRRGFQPVEGAHLREAHGYLAGNDAARAADLDAAIADPDTKAIWFARGGYGTARLLPLIDLPRLIKRPKLLIGYSDLTALDGALLRKARALCLHAPFIAELARPDAFHAPSLAAMLAGRKAVHRIAANDVLRAGVARGRLMGGNLTVLVHLLGTPYMPSLRGAVLFLEEAGEEAYRVDRMLNHLRASGALSGVKAVCVGQMVVPVPAREFPGDRAIDDVLADHLLPLGIPVVRGVPSGHGAGKWTLPVGGSATLDTKARTLEFDPRPAPLPTRGR